MSDASVIVIGAGIAGLSAAHHLVTNGFSNIIVLEASDRIGGRIHSEEFGDGTIELGANWIHGTASENSVFTFAKENEIIKEPFVILDRESIEWRTKSGKTIDPSLVKQATDIYEQIEEELEEGIKSEENISCERYFRDRIKEELESVDQENRHDVTLVLNSKLKEVGSYHSDDLVRISANRFYLVEEIEGDDVSVPEGYSKVIQRLADDLPTNVIRLGQKVTRINWNAETDSDGKINVQCDVNDGEDVVSANHVIITCSLGFLKENHESIFDPALPQWKTDAIEKMGFGVLELVFLKYETAFWNQGEGSFMIALEDDQNDDFPQWISSAYWVREIPTATNVLSIFLHGQSAREMPLVPKDEVSTICTKLIRKCLNDDTIPEPSEVKVSSWCTDPLYLGCYSFYSMESNVGCVKKLAKPLLRNDVPLLCFAGEATHFDWSSFTHGARSSAIREADRIIALYSDD